MLPLYMVVVIASTVSALDIPCQNGVEIKSHPITDANYMLGNWTYAYQWDVQNQFSVSPIDETGGRPLRCPWIFIEQAESDFIKTKKEECTGPMPFNWIDARLKMNIPSIFFRDTVIFIGEKKNWLLKNCKTIAEVEFIQVSGDLMVLNDVTLGVSMLMSRTALRRPELDCLVDNLDFGKKLHGFGLCN